MTSIVVLPFFKEPLLFKTDSETLKANGNTGKLHKINLFKNNKKLAINNVKSQKQKNILYFSKMDDLLNIGIFFQNLVTYN